jgi:hypothetical protein
LEITVLVQIADTRASGRKINLLHYVIGAVERVAPQVKDFLTETNEVPKAAACMQREEGEGEGEEGRGMGSLLFCIAVPLQNLATDLIALTNEVKGISKELETNDEPSATFREVFRISSNLFSFAFLPPSCN